MHSRPDPALRAVALPAVARAMVAKLQRLRAHPILNPAAFEESWRERAGHAVDPDHRPHLVAAADWLARAQDAAAQGAGDEKGKGGVARGYSLAWSPMCGSCAWQPPVPGGAGEIIPVLYSASRHLRRSALADRAEYAALWELDLQLPSGAMPASWTERPAPSVANTGQALLDWLAAFRETGAGIFAGAALAMVPAGRLPRSLASDWRPTASWGWLSGTAQMATIWLRLFETTRGLRWLAPVDTALRFLKSTQNRVSTDPGVHGGIKAAYPLGAEHGAYQLLVSGTAGFADALLRDERRRAGIAPMVATEAA